MAQIFSPAADTCFRLALVLAPASAVVGALLVSGLVRSDWRVRTDLTPVQPVPFSHEHHVSGLGLDCRNCHTGVETGARAGLPPTETCMTCHSQIWTQASILAPLRDSLARDAPLRWQRVARVPGYVYFRHDIHIHRGVGCVTCHGRVDQMPLMRRAVAFEMQFCVECHRDPLPELRPPERIFDTAWQPPGDARAAGTALAAHYGTPAKAPTDCYTCHR